MSGRPREHRPGVVTAVAILCWMVGTLEVLAGVLFLVFAALPATLAETSNSAVATSGVGFLVVGLAYLAVGFGIFAGVDFARVIVLLVGLLNFAVGLFTALSGQPFAGLVSMVVAVAIALPLWVGRGRLWFQRGHRTAP